MHRFPAFIEWGWAPGTSFGRVLGILANECAGNATVGVGDAPPGHHPYVTGMTPVPCDRNAPHGHRRLWGMEVQHAQHKRNHSCAGAFECELTATRPTARTSASKRRVNHRSTDRNRARRRVTTVAAVNARAPAPASPTGSRLSSQARGFPTAVSPELGDGGCSGATAVHARRAIAQSPGVASLGLGGLPFGGFLTPHSRCPGVGPL